MGGTGEAEQTLNQVGGFSITLWCQVLGQLSPHPIGHRIENMYIYIYSYPRYIRVLGLLIMDSYG